MSKNVKINNTVYSGVESVKLQTEGGGTAVFYDRDAQPSELDINFWDYDGTLLYAWTLAELAAKTELPPLPSHDGLICQGWNWTLADIKSEGRAVDVGANYITDDGKTRIYIHLEEGRTSPMLGCCPNGTVTVDWGDGTTPDTLTGTSTTTVKWTPNHAYAAPGDYVITLMVDGTFGFYGESTVNAGGALLRYTSGADGRNAVYQRAIQKIEVGRGVTSFVSHCFRFFYSLKSITIPETITSINDGVFFRCFSLMTLIIPRTLSNITTYAMCACYALTHASLPRELATMGSYAFNSDQSIARIQIPAGFTTLNSSTFYDCSGLSTLSIPSSVTSIAARAFYNCTGIKFYDFTGYTAVPTLADANAFTGIAADCEIRVPAALVDTWKAATNWSTYADQIVGVEA